MPLRLFGSDDRAFRRQRRADYQGLRPQDGLARLLEGDGWREFVAGRQMIDLLQAFPSRLAAEELTSLLRPLPARAYSIASSLLAHPEEAHLLVGQVAYRTHGRLRQGVASAYAAQRLAPGATVGTYLRPNRHFRLPEDGSLPIVMIGPGTGVAPFRAFLQQRVADGAAGRNWLFFGHRHLRSEFLYQTEWLAALKRGQLHRLDVAFSRDQPEKVYVNISNQRLAKYGLDTQSIMTQLGQQNAVEATGQVQTPSDVVQIRIGGQFQGIDQLKAMPIKGTNGTLLRLADSSAFTMRDSIGASGRSWAAIHRSRSAPSSGTDLTKNAISLINSVRAQALSRSVNPVPMASRSAWFASASPGCSRAAVTAQVRAA